MSNINQYLKNIMKAIYGKEVRQSIHDAIKENDKVADTAQNSATEMARAAQQAAAAAGQSEEAAGNSAAAAAVSKQEAGKSEVSAAESAAAALSNKNAAVAAAAGASASEQTAVQKAKEASVSAESAKGSEQAAGSAAQRAAEQSENASSKASEASVSAELAGRNADNASDAAVSAESYAHGGTGTRDREDVDNAKYYKEQAERISQGLAGGLLPMGTVIFSQLSQQTKHPGYMYNIADRFTTTEEFKEGAGHTYASGSNVYWTADGYWDCLAGTNVVKEDLDKKLGKTESTSNNIVNYDAGDNLSPTDWSEVAKLSSGETHKSLFQKMSLAVKNVRYLYKLFGSNDISDLGDGTASGAIKQLNTLLSQVDTNLKAVSASGIADSILINHSIGRTMSVDELLARREVTFFTNWDDYAFFPGVYGSGILIPSLDGNIKFMVYLTAHSMYYRNFNIANQSQDSGWICISGTKYTAP